MFLDNVSIHSFVIYLIISSVGAFKLDQRPHEGHRTSAAEINQDQLLPPGHRGQHLGPIPRQTNHEIEPLKINREFHNVDLDERDERDNHVQSAELVNDKEVESQLNKIAHEKDITKQRIDTEETLAKEDLEEEKEQIGGVPDKEQDNSRPGVCPEDTDVRGSQENTKFNEESKKSDKAEVIDHSSIESQPTKPPTTATSTTELEEIDEPNGEEYVPEEHSLSNNETSWDQTKHNTTLSPSTTTTNSGYLFNNGIDITKKQDESKPTSRTIKTQSSHEKLTHNGNETVHNAKENNDRNASNNVNNTDRNQQNTEIPDNATTNIKMPSTKATHKATINGISEFPKTSPSTNSVTKTVDNEIKSRTVTVTKGLKKVRLRPTTTSTYEKSTVKGMTKDMPLPSTKLKEVFISSSTLSDTITTKPTKHIKDLEGKNSSVVQSSTKPSIVQTKAQSTNTVIKTNGLKFESNERSVKVDVKDRNEADIVTTPYSTDRHTTYYDSSSVLASTLGGAFLGGLLILGMIYCKKRINRYVRGDYRRLPMEYDFELNPRLKHP